MANLTIENIPDSLLSQIEQRAKQENQSVNEQIISILKQTIEPPQKPITLLVSPTTDPTWDERRKATSQILADIEKRRLQRENREWLDSTKLIREDRDR